MDSGVVVLVLVAIGLPAMLAIALRYTAKWSGLRLCSWWALCVPVGYLIAVALTLADARFRVTGSGEGNLGAWISFVLLAAPIEALSNITGADWHVGGRLGQIRYWFLASVGVLLLSGFGLVVDALGVVISKRQPVALGTRSGRQRR